MAIRLRQIAKVGAYIVRQQLAGRKRYPLVLMLEPLFRCNLACAGCGKIDYPDAILDKRISVEDALASVDECGAPGVMRPRTTLFIKSQSHYSSKVSCFANLQTSAREPWVGRRSHSVAPNLSSVLLDRI